MGFCLGFGKTNNRVSDLATMNRSNASPLVFIIVLNWNGKDDTLECLSSLQKLDYPNFETVVVDNGSVDGSEEAIRASFPSVCFIQTGRNLGYAGGNNVGIKHALSHGADYVWLLNNDTTVDPMALTALVETAQADPRIAFVGSKIFFYDKPNMIWCAGGTIDLAEGGRTDHPGMGQEDHGQFDSISDVGYVTGCSLLASRAAIEAVGFLPEEYFLYFEETDWSLAAQRKGYRTVMAPASLVWHKYAEVGDYKNRFIYYSFRNRIRIVRKYAPRHILKAFQVNLSLLHEHISVAPGRARPLRLIAFLAHLDALLFRYGQAKWRIIS
jgi:GT2 family glycosyltransferase